MNKSVFSWSGGKDSALALYYVLQQSKYEVHTLLTSISMDYNRITMHGVHKELLYKQVKSLGLPLLEMMLPQSPSMETYNEIINNTHGKLKREGFTHSIYGDIFLEDLKVYRETQLAKAGLKAHFPFWKRNTTDLIHEFIDLGFKAIVVCVKSELLGSEFVGEIITKDFLKELPVNIDICGENGEFHTFVFDGPIFKKPIDFIIGDKVYKTYDSPKKKEETFYTNNSVTKEMGFHFCDLIPK
jgi:uncharacterized protein (TIGR00290 family)